jgi:hypothetical protein
MAFVLASAVCISLSGKDLQSATQSAFVLKPIPASAVHHSWQRENIKNANGTSSNWSGYAVFSSQTQTKKSKSSSTATFSDVTGSWMVPPVYASTSANTYSSSWLGIDGYADNTVEQIGTEQDWANGAPSYYAWFEMYPKMAYEIVNFPVAAGNTISAEVQRLSSGAFKLTITNVSANVSYSTTLRASSAQRLSAEWVEEAPWAGSVLPLADFGTAGFSNCRATLNGHNGPISDAAWQRDAINMQSGTTVKALTSALTSDGAGFNVAWEHE